MVGRKSFRTGQHYTSIVDINIDNVIRTLKAKLCDRKKKKGKYIIYSNMYNLATLK